MKRLSEMARFSAILMFVVGLSATVAFGQQVTGTILGRVTDSTGSVVAGAAIQVQNPATSFSRTDQADAEGRYLESNLPLGTYTVTVQKQGFQTLVRSGIVVTVGSQVTVNAELAVGDVQQHVEVTGEAPAIETSNATISGLVSQDQLRDLPLNGRSIDSLALLSPGIFVNHTTSQNATVGLGLHITVNGARQDWNLYLLDGTVTNDPESGRGSASGQQLGVEGILEFRILTHGASAEYGQYAGGVVSSVTRSGTNQFHGSVYEFWRNDKLNAVNYFAVTTPEFRRNQFGAAAGGPIKKDKLFFFINYEALRQRQGNPVVSTVPVLALRTAGSHTIGTTTFTVDPSIVPYINLYPPFNTANVQTNLSSVVTPPAATDATELVTTNFVQPTREDYAMGRLDWKISDKDSAFARYVFDPSKFTFSNAVPVWANTITGTDRFIALSETHVFSASALNEFRFAFNRTRPTQNSGSAPGVTIVGLNSLIFTPSALSIGTISSSTTTAGAASVSALGGNNASPQAFVKNLFQESDTFTKTVGAHTIKVGADIEREQLNILGCTSCNGQYTFSNFSNFLKGVPSLFTLLIQNVPTINSSAYKEYRHTLFGSFVQDDWRILPNLTLNLGLRWEFMTNPSEANGQMAGVINLGFPGATNTIGPAFITPKANFSPRIGLAWDPTGSGKTSIRASGGVYDNQLNDRTWFSNANSNSAFSLSIQPNPGIAPCNQYFKGANGTETGVITPNVSVASLLNPLTCNAGTGSQKDLNIQYYTQEPVVYQWNLEVQRQLVNTLSLRVGYVGSRGTHLPASVEMNPTKPTSVDANGIPIFPTATSTRINTLFGSMQSVMTSGVSDYQALQAILQKTTSMGLSFQASYTYGKAMSNLDSVTTGQISTSPATYMNLFNPNQDYSLSGFDQRHTLVINGAYDMPWGKWVTSAVAKKIAGGWAVNGIYSYGTGLPVTILVGGNQSNDGDSNNTDRPNLNAGYSTNPNSGLTQGNTAGNLTCTANGGPAAGLRLHTVQHWFDPCAFGLPTLGTFGNLGRNTVTGPGISDMDFTVVKLTPLTERFRLEFRAEVFNLLNHPMFGLVNNAVFTGKGSSTYSASAGQITATSIDQRELQLGLKLIF